MRISDWSSDVCSSDLPLAVAPQLQEAPYSLDDFRFIMGHARYRSGIAVAVDSPFESMADLIDAGRSGKELNYAATDALGAITMVRLGNTTGAQDRKSTRLNSSH